MSIIQRLCIVYRHEALIAEHEQRARAAVNDPDLQHTIHLDERELDQ